MGTTLFLSYSKGQANAKLHDNLHYMQTKRKRGLRIRESTVACCTSVDNLSQALYTARPQLGLLSMHPTPLRHRNPCEKHGSRPGAQGCQQACPAAFASQTAAASRPLLRITKLQCTCTEQSGQRNNVIMIGKISMSCRTLD